jgi:hypothetical protein
VLLLLLLQLLLLLLLLLLVLWWWLVACVPLVVRVPELHGRAAASERAGA